MNKKPIYFSMLAIFTLFLAINCRSQVVIVNLYSPPPNEWNVADLWNLTLTNTKSDPIKIYLTGTVEELSEGSIFSGTSAVFELAANFSGRIDPYILEPVDASYTNTEAEETVRKTGTMPEGIYTICIYVKDAQNDYVLGFDCPVIPITHPSPPELINPQDGAEVKEELPIFIWTPPMSLKMGDFVTYQLKIVELLDGQVPQEAMESNPAWFVEKGITSTSFQLPLSARSLEAGRSYAWQITAFNEKEHFEIDKSEVWMFTYGNKYQIRVDSLIIWTDGTVKENDFEYDFALFVTNENEGNANLYVTGITKTTPSGNPFPTQEDNFTMVKRIIQKEIVKKCIVKYEWDFDVVMIPSGEQGIMTGKIYTGKTKVKEICMEVKLEDLLYTNIFITTEVCDIPVDPIPDNYDFGDAPDPTFPSSAGSNEARHMWPAFQTSPNPSAWLGKAPLSYIGNNPVCPSSCSPQVDCIDFETNSIQTGDSFDDGIKFLSPMNSYCQECKLDSIDVTFTVNPNYDGTALLFYAWFDFNRDGDWDDIGQCDPSNSSDWYSEPIIWLKVRQLCPVTTNPPIFPNVVKFKCDPSLWGANCATYRFYFKTGKASTLSNEIWTRFRLTPGISVNGLNLSQPTGQVTYGEVEDYKIVCDSTPPPTYDFGDAPDELDNPALHYCTHLLNPDPGCIEHRPRPAAGLWSSFDAAVHQSFNWEWLGDIQRIPCSVSPVSVNAECNGQTINMDTEDDGITFSNLFKFPFQACDTQTVVVMINTSDVNRYNWDIPLKLHAWFDWEQDGSWEETNSCDPSGSDPNASCDDHIRWLTGQSLGPGGVFPPFTINSYSFDVVPNDPAVNTRWPNQGNCQIYKLSFLAGPPANNSVTHDTLWCRFRLFFRDFRPPASVSYYGSVPFGEVEDYPIIRDSTEACGPFIDARDSKAYNAVQIGTQCWMADNLDYSTNGSFINGTLNQNNDAIVEKYCYNNLPANCTDYGGLYQWAEALGIPSAYNTTNFNVPPGNIQGICPLNWHIPSDQEWCILENFLESPINCNAWTWNRGNHIGEYLKESGNAHWNSFPSILPATNSSGFTALGGGAKTPSGFLELKEHGHWWATQEHNASGASFRHLFYFNNEIGRGGAGAAKVHGHSVRCIRNY